MSDKPRDVSENCEIKDECAGMYQQAKENWRLLQAERERADRQATIIAQNEQKLAEQATLEAQLEARVNELEETITNDCTSKKDASLALERQRELYMNEIKKLQSELARQNDLALGEFNRWEQMKAERDALKDTPGGKRLYRHMHEINQLRAEVERLKTEVANIDYERNVAASERDKLESELEDLRAKYNERGMTMQDTADVVRSLYIPERKILLKAEARYGRKFPAAMPLIEFLLARDIDLELKLNDTLTRYRQCERANSEWTKNDQVTFGKLYEEREQLNADLAQAQRDYEREFNENMANAMGCMELEALCDQLAEALDFALDGACRHEDTRPGNGREWCHGCSSWVYPSDRQGLADAQAALSDYKARKEKL